MIRKLIIPVLFISILIFNGCGKKGLEDSENQTAVPVEIMNAGLGNVVQSLTFNGDIMAQVEVKVFAKIPDRIEAFYVDDGDFIQKGRRIAKILATTIEQAVLQAEAGLTAAKAQEANLTVEYERAKRLQKENAMSQQQFDGIQTQYEAVAAQVQQSEAAVVSARSQLQDATVTAPISGIIGKRYYEVGDMATPALPLVSIVQMDKVKIKFDATEEDLGRLAIGQKADISVRSYPNQVFTGEIIKISPVLDPLTRMAEVEVLIPNAEHQLRPGMFAKAEITTGILQNVLVVPRFSVIENTSIRNIDGKDEVVKNYFIYVVNDSLTAEQRQLEVSYVNHKQVAVREGIKTGEKFVTAGQNNLRDGMLVRIIDNEEVE